MQNTSKWRGKLFCWVCFFHQNADVRLLRRVVLLVCHHARSQWGDEDMGIGPGQLMGHGFDVAQVQNWAVTEVLPPKIRTCRGVASSRTGFALCGTAALKEMKLFGIIKNEAGINPHTSSTFSLGFFCPLLKLLL